MKCPHCTIAFHEEWEELASAGRDVDGTWKITKTTCPECERIILELDQYGIPQRMGSMTWRINNYIFRPRAAGRAPLSPDVPDEFAKDYREACLVLADSPNASGALSRRCLQNLLREKAGVEHSDLYHEIGEAIPKLTSSLAQAIDSVRKIGNFASHPIKSTSSGEIVDVEPGEAEWTLDTLEGLFDHYFVQPELLKRKLDALNQKLEDAGVPPMQQRET